MKVEFIESCTAQCCGENKVQKKLVDFENFENWLATALEVAGELGDFSDLTDLTDLADLADLADLGDLGDLGDLVDLGDLEDINEEAERKEDFQELLRQMRHRNIIELQLQRTADDPPEEGDQEWEEWLVFLAQSALLTPAQLLFTCHAHKAMQDERWNDAAWTPPPTASLEPPPGLEFENQSKPLDCSVYYAALGNLGNLQWPYAPGSYSLITHDDGQNWSW